VYVCMYSGVGCMEGRLLGGMGYGQTWVGWWFRWLRVGKYAWQALCVFVYSLGSAWIYRYLHRIRRMDA
jgi:hypothetical protein